MDCKPNAFILGISALSVWGGNQQWCEDLKRRVRKVAGWDIPVAIASDAVAAGLKRHGIKKKIAIMEPYYPSHRAAHARCWAARLRDRPLQPHARQEPGLLFRPHGARHDQGDQLDRRPDVEAIVQFGANLPMAKLADEAERWLDKPVISINVATYWHACA